MTTPGQVFKLWLAISWQKRRHRAEYRVKEQQQSESCYQEMKLTMLVWIITMRVLEVRLRVATKNIWFCVSISSTRTLLTSQVTIKGMWIFFFKPVVKRIDPSSSQFWSTQFASTVKIKNKTEIHPQGWSPQKNSLMFWQVVSWVLQEYALKLRQSLFEN